MQDLPMPLHQDEPGHPALEADPQHRRLDQGLLPLLLERGGEAAGRGNAERQQKAGEKEQTCDEENWTKNFLRF